MSYPKWICDCKLTNQLMKFHQSMLSKSTNQANFLKTGLKCWKCRPYNVRWLVTKRPKMALKGPTKDFLQLHLETSMLFVQCGRSPCLALLLTPNLQRSFSGVTNKAGSLTVLSEVTGQERVLRAVKDWDHHFCSCILPNLNCSITENECSCCPNNYSNL